MPISGKPCTGAFGTLSAANSGTDTMSDSTTDKTGNLIWIDLEMTGLDTMQDSIIEIATIVTDRYLNELAEGPVLAISHERATLDAMDRVEAATLQDVRCLARPG